jgi:hypothetical protein
MSRLCSNVGSLEARSVRNEPQHDHTLATTKTKMRAPLIGFSHSQKMRYLQLRMLQLASAPATYIKPNLRAKCIDLIFVLIKRPNLNDLNIDLVFPCMSTHAREGF